ncbi:Coenzyme F420 hydrogenase/dehydrogenase, beta subunit C-terminal domain [Saccharicrinis sp. 156]|uniref:Coenzyme F420 hydrogenase/dehydrogenase, beta subunit C-terminal domain n=1 Tax=Saccharicrinis sp. 156 TaxID=3417574 RepID=UPI003D357E1F
MQEEKMTLKSTVIDNGYCIGCGVCCVVKDSNYSLKFDNNLGVYTPEIAANVNFVSDEEASKVCPFSNEALDEMELGRRFFNKAPYHNDKLGYFISTHAGYVTEKEFREKGSSGGLTTWLLSELFDKGLVDAVLHIKENKKSGKSPVLFNYQISNTLEEIKEGAKTKYYPIELSGVLEVVKNSDKKFAIVGVPCFIKAIRLLGEQNSIIKERVKYTIGLVCGHLKSAHFANMWGWQLGIHPKNIKNIDFRTKLDGYGANEYGVSVRGDIDGKEITKVSPPLNRMFGANWGWGLFKLKACDCCDDVVAETADITIGDAWLPRYVKDSKGTSVIVIRNFVIHDLMKNASGIGRIFMEDIAAIDVIKSQEGGFRHRREGLAYRISLLAKQDLWFPKKRFGECHNLNNKQKAIQNLRTKIREKSLEAMLQAISKNDFKYFIDYLKDDVNTYQKLYRKPLYLRIVNKIKKFI